MRSVTKFAFIRVSLILVTMLSNATAQTRRQPADLLVVGGTIVTMDQERRVIPDGGIAVSQGRIVAVGPRAGIPFSSSSTATRATKKHKKGFCEC